MKRIGTMPSITSKLRTAAAKRAAYYRTISEISSLPADFAMRDLGIYPGDARKIAWETVYGK
jgi:hypothetical protein